MKHSISLTGTVGTGADLELTRQIAIGDISHKPAAVSQVISRKEPSQNY